MKKLGCLLLIRLFNILFPIRQNKVLFISYYGAQYGCNPKYLSQYLANQNQGWDIVWAFTHPDEYQIEGIRKVRYSSLAYFYELCTCKVLVTNYRMTELFKKRKHQLYIQTWHSSLRLKMIENDVKELLPPSYIRMAKADSRNIDLLLSGCEFSTSTFKRCFWYNGEIIQTGTPRNDLLFKEDLMLRQQILQRVGIPQHTHMALYAPTYHPRNKKCYDLDFQELSQALKTRFGGNWIIAIRLHPHLRNISKQLLTDKTTVIDVTQYDDIQELLFAADILISDYSSLIFDYAITKRPCFLYVPNLTEYTSQERTLYFDINELPFSASNTYHELIDKIIHFDTSTYEEKVTKFLESVGSYEDGHAAERVVNHIIRHVSEYKK